MAKQKEKRISTVRNNGVDWTVEKVKQSILTNDQAVKNALLRLYSWQTEEEKQSQDCFVMSQSDEENEFFFWLE